MYSILRLIGKQGGKIKGAGEFIAEICRLLTGHFLGDSLGMTPFIRALREKGLEVVCMGGIIDLQNAGYEVA